MAVHPDLQNATSVNVIGSRPKELRPATRIISKAIKFGLLAGVAVATWMVIKPSTEPQTQTAPTEVSTGSTDANMKTSGSSQVGVSTRASAATLVDQSRSNAITANTVNDGIEDLTGLKSFPTTAQIPVLDLSDIQPSSSAYKLAIDVRNTDTAPALAVKFYRAGQLFQAAALQLEGMELKPYYIEGDSTQPTIGVGYNIKMSATAIGREGVRRELTQAGIDRHNVDLLMSSEQAVSSQASISVQQSTALLDIATKRFRDSTRAAVGATTFDALPANRQAALMLIDYNSNIHKRTDLVSSVRSGSHQQAIDQMETTITVHGRRVINPNVVLAQTMYHSADGARRVIMDPNQIKRDGARNLLAWQQASAVQSAPTASPQQVPAFANASAATNIHVTAGTAQRVSGTQSGTQGNVQQGNVQQGNVQSNASAEEQARAAQQRIQQQLQGASNVRSSQPQLQEVQSGAQHQVSPESRSRWLNARNARSVQEPQPTIPSMGR